MILVLVLVYVILQKDFSLVVHLGVNILTQETANQANTGKSQRCKRRHLEAMCIRPFEGSSCGSKNFTGLGILLVTELAKDVHD